MKTGMAVLATLALLWAGAVQAQTGSAVTTPLYNGGSVTNFTGPGGTGSAVTTPLYGGGSVTNYIGPKGQMGSAVTTPLYGGGSVTNFTGTPPLRIAPLPQVAPPMVWGR